MPKANLSVKAGSLFDAHATFMQVTGQRYDAMAKRLEKKGLGKPPFTKDELRADALSVFNEAMRMEQQPVPVLPAGSYTLVEIAIDHAVPSEPRPGALRAGQP